MRQLTSAFLMLSGICAGFSTWLYLRRHVCKFELLLRAELDPEQFPSVSDISTAQWDFMMCTDPKCLMTREAIGIMHTDKTVEVFACEPTASGGLLEENEDVEEDQS